MTTVYDAGVLIAAETGDADVWAEHKALLLERILPVVPAPVLAQASRSPRQARLSMLLGGCDVTPFEADQAHRVGALLGAAGAADVVDAHVGLVAADAADDHVRILTSDAEDIERLVEQTGRAIVVRRV